MALTALLVCSAAEADETSTSSDDTGEDTSAGAGTDTDSPLGLGGAGGAQTEVRPRVPSRAWARVGLAVFAGEPPLATCDTSFPLTAFTKADTQNTLADTADLLTSLLFAAGYEQLRYFPLPDGYVVITRMERFDSSGKSSVKHRYAVTKGTAPRATFLAKLWGKVTRVDPDLARYRVFVFVARKHEHGYRQLPLTKTMARRWWMIGRNKLGKRLPGGEVTREYTLEVLVYEFEEHPDRKGPVQLTSTATMGASEHLRAISFPVPRSGQRVGVDE